MLGGFFMLICPTCGNCDVNDFYFLKDHYYCRKCLGFKGKKSYLTSQIVPKKVVMNLSYSLSQEQQELSKKLLVHNEDQEIKAVCGAGKTEIVLALIQQVIEKGGRVGFIIPRVEIVKEIYERVKKIFLGIRVVAVYGGHCEKLEGDLIVLTCHQAFRYQKAFRLVILDEADAFPYYQNQILSTFVQQTVDGKMVRMSATMQSNSKVLLLNKRYHGEPIPVPKIKKYFLFRRLLKLVKKYCKQKKPFFIYVPTIENGKKLLKKFTRFPYKIDFIHSKTKNKNVLLEKVKHAKLSGLITTTLLERGITYCSLQVIVYQSEHFIFSKNTLIQIAGRVGRKIEDTKGDVFFLCQRRTKEMKDAIKEIKHSNQSMSSV